MKNTQAISGLSLFLLLAAQSVHAQDYPASNFQPKVIYSSEAAAKPAPAISSSPCQPKAEQVEIDAKYPAANFQPKVIFSSADAKKGS